MLLIVAVIGLKTMENQRSEVSFGSYAKVSFVFLSHAYFRMRFELSSKVSIGAVLILRAVFTLSIESMQYYLVILFSYMLRVISNLFGSHLGSLAIDSMPHLLSIGSMTIMQQNKNVIPFLMNCEKFYIFPKKYLTLISTQKTI